MEVRANLVAYRGHMLPVWGVACSPHPHGFYFASAGADRTARVWSTERIHPLRVLAGKSFILLFLLQAPTTWQQGIGQW